MRKIKGNARTRTFRSGIIGIVLGVALGAQDVLASELSSNLSGDVIDLSVGIANPSNNAAILENPAGLTNFRDEIVDVAGLLGSAGGPDFAGSLSSGSEHFGFGVGFERVAGNLGLSGAFAAGTGKFSIGIDTSFLIGMGSPTFDLGLRYDADTITYALALRNLVNFGQVWSFGLGVTPFKIFRVGFDFNFQSTTPIIGVNAVNIVGIGEFFESHKYSFRMSYGFGVIPAFIGSEPPFGLALSYWFSKKVAAYASYNDYFVNYTFILGLKFDLS